MYNVNVVNRMLILPYNYFLFLEGNGVALVILATPPPPTCHIIVIVIIIIIIIITIIFD